MASKKKNAEKESADISAVYITEAREKAAMDAGTFEDVAASVAESVLAGSEEAAAPEEV